MSIIDNFKRALPTYFAEYKRWTHDGLFHLLHARRGRGKTYNMCDLANAGVSAHVPIIGNIEFNHAALARVARSRGAFPTTAAAFAWIEKNVIFTNDIDKIMLAYDSIVLLDETQRDFNINNRSRDVRVPDVFLEWLEQSRKHKVTICFASQSFDWLDLHTKQLADVLWESRRVGRDRAPLGFYCYGTDPKGAGGSLDKNDTSMIIKTPFNLQVAQTYNTFQALPRLTRESRFKYFVEIAAHLEDIGVRPSPRDTRTFDAFVRDEHPHLLHDSWRASPRPVRPSLRYL